MGLLAQAWLQLQHQAEYPPLVAVFPCVLALVLLISWLRARRSYHRLKQDVDKLKQELDEVQGRYDREVHWRIAGEKQKTAEPATNAPNTGMVTGTEEPARSHAQGGGSADGGVLEARGTCMGELRPAHP